MHVAIDRITEIADALVEQGFLDSPHFAEPRAAIDHAFLEAPPRPAAHGGGAYPLDPSEIHAFFDGFFAPPEGPGPVDGSGPGRPRVAGVIAPHIDFHRGRSTYAWAYRDLAERSDADLFVVFGTCHAGMEHPFALTLKSYESPLGQVPVDREFAEALAKRAQQDCFGSELAHRTEHSIEFQAVFLRYLFAGRRELSIVPVLASFAHEALVGRRPVDDDPRIPRFFDALGQSIAASGRRGAPIPGAGP